MELAAEPRGLAEDPMASLVCRTYSQPNSEANTWRGLRSLQKQASLHILQEHWSREPSTPESHCHVRDCVGTSLSQPKGEEISGACERQAIEKSCSGRALPSGTGNSASKMEPNKFSTAQDEMRHSQMQIATMCFLLGRQVWLSSNQTSCDIKLSQHKAPEREPSALTI